MNLRLFFRLLAGLLFAAPLSAAPKQFHVVAYNVENLFDLDGIALFDEYKQDSGDPEAYNRRKFLTKLETVAEVLGHVDNGRGPAVILFQELEADFTPESGIDTVPDFLDRFADTTVRAMLTDRWRPAYAGFPAHAWLAKALDDAGMRGYTHVAVAPAKPMDKGIAHANAVFSRFPIRRALLHPTDQARDIQEVEIDVAGHRLILFNNHWKSGASSPEREPIRVGNARVLRARVEAILAEDPFADIIIGGDLNSHYNHSRLFPEITTGINDILGSQGDEGALLEADGPALYNLWFELPPGERYAEVWRGRRGTLMHLIVSRGLYDLGGVGYVDGSFDKMVLPGLNADVLGRPLSWYSGGTTGGGASDHFPIIARFEVRSGRGVFPEIASTSDGADAPDYEMPLRFEPGGSVELLDGRFLGNFDPSRVGPYTDRIFRVQAEVVDARPLRLRVGDQVWDAYAYQDALFEALRERRASGEPMPLAVSPNYYRGKPQLIVEAILPE